MTSEKEIRIYARLRAHESLIQDLLCLAFQGVSRALRDHGSRIYASLDIGKKPALSPAEEVRVSYETHEAIAQIVVETVLRAEKQRTR